MKIKILLQILFLLLVSCSPSEESSRIEKLNRLNKQKEKLVNDLVIKYDVKYIIDTLNFKYSIDFHPVVNSRYQLIQDGDITDIYKRDSIDYITINTGYSPTFYIDLQANHKQIEQLRSGNNYVILVIDLESIKKLKFTLEGEFNSEFINLNLEDSEDFKGTGKLIDVITLPKPKLD
ncbi:hypothetical protein [Pontibacter pudoricolor]|uniref:hypothetical protein n=1 Tax=Pontibacter pudoricolor TaxID=2694930 RepID=UPI001391989E|nr:hypothetical protein [Pontibacter pudoricolor]